MQDVEESPDEQRIAFVAVTAEQGTEQLRLFITDSAAAGPLTQLAVPAGNPERWQGQTSPAWSPDGSILAYVLEEVDSRGEYWSSIREIDLSSGADTPMYEPATPVRLRRLSWTPDGRTLVVTQSGLGGIVPGAAFAINRENRQPAVIAEGAGLEVALAAADATIVAEIAVPVDRLEDDPLSSPVLNVWTDGRLNREELPAAFAFGAQLTIAECAYAGP